MTYRRRPLFRDAWARECLGDSFRECLTRQPFRLDAIVLLPDHLHTIWTLPPGDFDFSGRWSRIKRKFTRTWLTTGGRETPPHAEKRPDPE
ncbi:MAG: transposase [Planctomycetaceae bacterium]